MPWYDSTVGRRYKNETELQKHILEHLLRHPMIAWICRFNTGAVEIEDRFVRFAVPGFPDLHGYLKIYGIALYIEVKTPKGKLSDDQRDFLDLAQANGACVGVARSVREAMDIVNRFLEAVSRG